MRKDFQRARILLVHAHPDDETINNGATMAMYAALGAKVTLVTCTRGEEGEVLVPELAHIAASEKDELGAHREVELAEAMKALGVSDFRFLGAPQVSYRDSGMMDTPRVAMEAAKRSTWKIPKIYWNTMPKSVIADGIEKMKALGSDFFGAESADDLPFAKDDEAVTTLIDGNEYVQAKMDAMAAHKTQIALDGPFFALSNNIGLQVWGNEYYTLVHGQPHEPFDKDGRETDLLAGVDF